MVQRVPRIIGHGGAKGYAPKNTKASFEKALELGVDMVEFDLHQPKDGIIVIYHDPYLDRTTNVHGLIGEKWIKELQNIDVGSWFNPKFKDERILTFEEGLELMLDKIDLIIELKQVSGNDRRYEGFEERVLKILNRKNAKKRVLITSFDHYSLKRLKKLDPSIRIGLLFGANWVTLWKEVELLKPEAIHPHWVFTTRKMVEEAHSRGLKVNVWVVNEENWMRKLISWEVDGIITDYPDRLVHVLREIKCQI